MAIREIEEHPNQPPQSEKPAPPAKVEDNVPGHLMGMGALRDEITLVEAANKPLPLAELDDAEVVVNVDGGSQSPLGPL